MPNCMCAFRPHKTWIHAAFWPRARLTPSSLNGNLRIWSRELLKGEQVEFSLPGLGQRFGFKCESRFSPDMPQSGKTCSMEYATKAGLCRRLSRRVNIIASKHPVKAPSNASVIDRSVERSQPLAGQKKSGIRHRSRPENQPNSVHGGLPFDEQILPQSAIRE